MNTIKIPEILLPANVNMTAWAVNACDQFTSDEKYWKSVREQVGLKPSTYNLIYPEIYLNDHPESRIKAINSAMQQYVDGGIFREITGGFILVERTTESGTRTGLVLAVDLEDYSFEKGSKALIRSTEATILERIPPRVKIRENAVIELPHVMLLYDDRQNVVLNAVKRGDELYDFELMMNGGRVKGTYVPNAEEVIQAFDSLLDDEVCTEKYGVNEKLLFAVGDGNHSLATAKTCWENLKQTLTPEQRQNHPARFALVEAVNIYDPALKFEPIHRLVKTDKAEEFADSLGFTGDGRAEVVVNGVRREIAFPSDVPEGIRLLDAAIAKFIATYGGEADYIHGEEELISLSSCGVGVLLPPISKDDFFRLIISGGNLPRKTFSMGEGNEKRYYIEAKKIK